jgi:acyl carrier protein
MSSAPPADQVIRERVRQFIAKNFFVTDIAALDDDSSLLEKGIIDSTGMLEVIGFLESSFEVRVEDDEMLPENLDSVGRIVAFVARKTK